MTDDAFTPFGEVVESAIGGGWGAEDVGEQPVRIIRGTDLHRASNGDLSECPLRFETQKRADRRMLFPDDLILEISGGSSAKGQTTGRSMRVPESLVTGSEVPLIPASFCRLIRLDRTKVDPRYVEYHLKDMYLSGRAGLYENRSTGISNFQFKYFLEEEQIRLPSLEEQRAIGTTLGQFDSKIRKDRKLAKTLEEIASALFRAQFVDFIEHDVLVESELGPIPVGWDVVPLSHWAEVTMGQSPPSSAYSPDSTVGPVMVQGKGAFGDRFPKRQVFCSAPTRLAESGTILITVRAPVGDLNVCRELTCLGRGVAGVASEYPSFVEGLLRASVSRWRSEESGTIYPSVNKKQVAGFKAIAPPTSEVEGYESTVRPMLDLVNSLKMQSETLAEIRDTLLPRLISGEIRVPEVEEIVEEIA